MFRFRCEDKGLVWGVEWESGAGEQVSRWAGEQEKEDDRFDSTLTHLPTHPPARLLVHGDEGKLRQVLINLLSNAVKFTEEGSIILRIDETNTEDHVSRFTFHVIDTGVGISPEDQATIFEPFQQGEKGATKGGTGLGLTIAKKQVELMSGKFAFESEPGIGSRFRFTVPFAPAVSEVFQPSLEAGKQIAHLAAGYSVKALVADDVQENRDVLSRVLTDIGVEVLTASDGAEAVEKVSVHRPDIVFMDIRMPVVDGLEAAQQILTKFGRDALKLVAISASVFAHEREKYLAIGFDAFIAKPFLAERIYDCLANLLSIEYEYETAVAAESPIDFAQITLPEDLLTRLKQAAENYRTTEFKRHLSEVDQSSEERHRLAEHLQSLLQNYDMEAIMETLSKIPQA